MQIETPPLPPLLSDIECAVDDSGNMLCDATGLLMLSRAGGSREVDALRPLNAILERLSDPNRRECVALIPSVERHPLPSSSAFHSWGENPNAVTRRGLIHFLTAVGQRIPAERPNVEFCISALCNPRRATPHSPSINELS